ncbi:hypothetical protein PR048_016734 [Dryococelus australis]|uniref:Uncharacterized protein n=1 Tax=Dryococelus australis TaxID=614101 RepID=A0ABQ9H835_9NEOP|nr:hypothetical protein PR048_016734 [Dryococelus australis]
MCGLASVAPHARAPVPPLPSTTPLTFSTNESNSLGRCNACGNRGGRRLWSTGFLGALPFAPTLRFGAAPYSTRVTLIGSQDIHPMERKTSVSDVPRRRRRPPETGQLRTASTVSDLTLHFPLAGCIATHPVANGSAWPFGNYCPSTCLRSRAAQGWTPVSPATRVARPAAVERFLPVAVEIPERTRRPAASFGAIPTCKNPETTSPGIEPGSPRICTVRGKAGRLVDTKVVRDGTSGRAGRLVDTKVVRDGTSGKAGRLVDTKVVRDGTSGKAGRLVDTKVVRDGTSGRAGRLVDTKVVRDGTSGKAGRLVDTKVAFHMLPLAAASPSPCKPVPAVALSSFAAPNITCHPTLTLCIPLRAPTLPPTLRLFNKTTNRMFNVRQASCVQALLVPSPGEKTAYDTNYCLLNKRNITRSDASWTVSRLLRRGSSRRRSAPVTRGEESVSAYPERERAQPRLGSHGTGPPPPRVLSQTSAAPSHIHRLRIMYERALAWLISSALPGKYSNQVESDSAISLSRRDEGVECTKAWEGGRETVPPGSRGRHETSSGCSARKCERAALRQIRRCDHKKDRLGGRGSGGGCRCTVLLPFPSGVETKKPWKGTRCGGWLQGEHIRPLGAVINPLDAYVILTFDGLDFRVYMKSFLVVYCPSFSQRDSGCSEPPRSRPAATKKGVGPPGQELNSLLELGVKELLESGVWAIILGAFRKMLSTLPKTVRMGHFYNGELILSQDSDRRSKYTTRMGCPNNLTVRVAAYSISPLVLAVLSLLMMVAVNMQLCTVCQRPSVCVEKSEARVRRKEVRMEPRWNARARKTGDPEKTHQPSASSNTIPTCENPGVSWPGIEAGSPWWEASNLPAQPPRSLDGNCATRVGTLRIQHRACEQVSECLLHTGAAMRGAPPRFTVRVAASHPLLGACTPLPISTFHLSRAGSRCRPRERERERRANDDVGETNRTR